MRTMQDWIKELMRLYEQDVPDSPMIPDAKTIKLRRSLVTEEVGETIRAIEKKDLVEIADGLADVLVVVLGTQNAFGLMAGRFYRGTQPDHAPCMIGDDDCKSFINYLAASLNDFQKEIDSASISIEAIEMICDEIEELVCDTIAPAFGIDIMPVFLEVHWSNKTKFNENGKPVKNEAGKVIKGPLYQKPNIAAVLEQQKKFYLHSK